MHDNSLGCSGSSSDWVQDIKKDLLALESEDEVVKEVGVPVWGGGEGGARFDNGKEGFAKEGAVYFWCKPENLKMLEPVGLAHFYERELSINEVKRVW